VSEPFTLHLGDCLPFLRSLPDKSVDHVITDPPYEAEAHGASRRLLGGVIDRTPLDFGAITADVRVEFSIQAERVARGWVLAFCQVEAVWAWKVALESSGAGWRRAMVWVKPDGSPQLTGDRPGQSYECMALAWAGVGRSVWNGGGKRGIYTFNVNDFGRLPGGRPHPTMKPLRLMEALVRDFTNEGETILDPFAGSGTTGVAAIRLGRKFIGCERDPKYHAVAVKRLSQAREQLGLWNGAA
jgi:site-specific DNA-methyltransferase (adenine-specific)